MNTLIKLLKYSKASKSKIIIASIFSALNQIIDILPDLLVGVAVNIVVSKESSFLSYFGIHSPIYQLIILGIITAVVYLLESLTELLYSLLWRSLAQKIQSNLRNSTYEHLQNLEISFFENTNTGTLLTILVDDINLLEHFFNDGANDVIQLIISTLMISVVFLYISPMITLLAFLSTPVILLITFYFQKHLKIRYLKIREAAANLANLITNNILGIVTIKSYTAEKLESNNVRAESDKYLQEKEKTIIINSTFNPMVRIVIMFSYIISLVLGGILTLKGKLDVGSYSVLVFLTQRALWPFTDLAWLTDLYQRTMASANRILNILTTPLIITNQNEILKPDTVKGHIIFNKVSFCYPNGKEVFKDLSFEILPGQTIAFVGSTGSGKSTIIKLLLKFYNILSGQILIDNINLDNCTTESVRKAMGLVSQDVFLVNGTIKHNIAYGNPEASLDQVINASKIAQAYDFIMKLPNKFDTVISQSGLTLSGGQKQRISIARAILKNAPIFIFDEATSALDNETERAIQEALEAIEKDHTTIIIAHRLSTIRNADNIFVMDNGKIVESGPHDKLVQLGGIYARLWKLQTGEI